MPEPVVFEVNEKTTPTYRATIKDDQDPPQAIPLATLLTLTLTLYVVNADGTTTILNSRSQQNVLNANNVTVDATGHLAYTLQIADTTIANAALPFERHIALFEWTWPTSKAGKHEVIFSVRNLTRVS